MLYDEAILKDYNTMVEDAIDRLKDKTELTDFSAGSLARSLIEVFYDDLDDLYRDLSQVAKKYFISDTEGIYLDELALLFGIEREQGEDDGNFRYRIKSWTETRAAANEIAVRLACLSVDSVIDIKIKKYVRGTGTFDAYVITEDPETPSEVISEVQEKIDSVQSAGVKGLALSPKLKYIDFTLQYTFFSNVNADDKTRIVYSAEEEIREYLANLELGSELVLNRLIDILMSVDRNKIKNVEILKMFVDGRETIIGNKNTYWDERIVPGDIKIN
jgi:uncharacterized phage protein gp47/JayE